MPKSRNAVVTAAIRLGRLVPSTETTVQSSLLLLSIIIELLPLMLRASWATLQTCSCPCEERLSADPARGLAGQVEVQRGGNALFSGTRCIHLPACIGPPGQSELQEHQTLLALLLFPPERDSIPSGQVLKLHSVQNSMGTKFPPGRQLWSLVSWLYTTCGGAYDAHDHTTACVACTLPCAFRVGSKGQSMSSD